MFNNIILNFFLCFFHTSLLDTIVDITEISTPVVLFIWFLVTQRQKLSSEYFKEIPGIYAGFTETTNKDDTVQVKGNVYSGVIMKIISINNNGYFIGEFRYGENITIPEHGEFRDQQLKDGIYTFLGKLDFKVYFRSKRRHPYKDKRARIYNGRLYIIDRLDYDHTKHDFEDYIRAEYKIVHYRDRSALYFHEFKKVKKDLSYKIM